MTATDDEDEDVDEAGCGERAAVAVVGLHRLCDSSPPAAGSYMLATLQASGRKPSFPKQNQKPDNHKFKALNILRGKQAKQKRVQLQNDLMCVGCILNAFEYCERNTPNKNESDPRNKLMRVRCILNPRFGARVGSWF